MSYPYPVPVTVSYKTVQWQGRSVRVARLDNEPGSPSVFFSGHEAPVEDPNADKLDQILAELAMALPADELPLYVLSTRYFPPVPAGLEHFPDYKYKDDHSGWTTIQLQTYFN